MSNFQDNGAILPSGLLSTNAQAMLGAFKKTYQNCALRVGIVTATYGIKDSANVTKTVLEYDVQVIEQNEDQGSTTITYKNCIASSGFGSKTDFFEATLRRFTQKSTKEPVISPSGQNGAIVLLLCLNGLSDTGVIISALNHPDHPTTLINDEPHLEGEYNGVNIKVNSDGSTSLTFNGAKDNDGKILDASQGVTTIDIEKDGTFQVGHGTIKLRLAKDGTTTLTGKKDAVITVEGNVTINAKADVNVNCANATVTAKKTATIEGKTVLLGADAAEAVVKGDTFKKLYDAHIHPTAVGPSGPPVMPLAPTALSKKVKTE